MRYPPVFFTICCYFNQNCGADFSRNIEFTLFAAKTDYHLVIGIS